LRSATKSIAVNAFEGVFDVEFDETGDVFDVTDGETEL
jgi:hypothetical protein